MTIMDKFVVRSKRRAENEDSSQSCRSAKSIRLDNGNATSKMTEPLKSEVSEDSDFAFRSLVSLDTTHNHVPDIKWTVIKGENLKCNYTVLYPKKLADLLLKRCEEEIEYNSGKLAQVQIFGQWHNIPRKQAAFGDSGLSYNFSGNSIPAKPWTPLLTEIRDFVSDVTGHKYNFVLINRYKDGEDHMGEHRDDEKDLVRQSPIASLSLGQHRDFVFKHKDARGAKATRKIPTITKELEHGSLLVMRYPTNQFWYHSLPKRKNAPGIRINMTFRDFVV